MKVIFDYAVEGTKEEITKKLNDYGLKVIGIDMNGPGGDWPEITAEATRENLVVFVRDAYDADMTIDQFLEEFEVALPTQNQKLQKALNILQDISDNWNEDDVVTYSPDLPSFDEVVSALREIEFKE